MGRSYWKESKLAMIQRWQKNGPSQAYAAFKVDATCFSGVQSAPQGLFL